MLIGPTGGVIKMTLRDLQLPISATEPSWKVTDEKICIFLMYAQNFLILIQSLSSLKPL